ncbi:AraC family transcriptional regulator [Bacillus gobiensis]|uniref:helix-turn-helix domain-containing protein n=1 Tax=Bacillus gobiensis TaxID=1441095 RepID=UPI003D2181F6
MDSKLINCCFRRIVRKNFCLIKFKVRVTLCKRCRPDLFSNLNPREQIIKKTTDFLINNYSCELSLEDIAKRVYASPFYLQRIFKEEMKMSPAQFLTTKRMEAAKELIMHTSLSITAIAYEVGFKSSSHFSTLFRKSVGLSPSDYRLVQKQQSSSVQY